MGEPGRPLIHPAFLLQAKNGFPFRDGVPSQIRIQNLNGKGQVHAIQPLAAAVTLNTY